MQPCSGHQTQVTDSQVGMLGKARHGGMLEKAEQDGGTKPRGHPGDAEEAPNHQQEETDDACTATGSAPLATAGARTGTDGAQLGTDGAQLGTDGAQLGTDGVHARRKSNDAEIGTNEMALTWHLVTGL